MPRVIAPPILRRLAATTGIRHVCETQRGSQAPAPSTYFLICSSKVSRGQPSSRPIDGYLVRCWRPIELAQGRLATLARSRPTWSRTVVAGRWRWPQRNRRSRCLTAPRPQRMKRHAWGAHAELRTLPQCMCMRCSSYSRIALRAEQRLERAGLALPFLGARAARSPITSRVQSPITARVAWRYVASSVAAVSAARAGLRVCRLRVPFRRGRGRTVTRCRRGVGCARRRGRRR